MWLLHIIIKVKLSENTEEVGLIMKEKMAGGLLGSIELFLIWLN